MSTADRAEDRAEWVTVGTYATGLEADIARSTLEEADIPVLVRGNTAGIFGQAFQGDVPGGVTLQVPSPESERALTLLGEINAELDYDTEIEP